MLWLRCQGHMARITCVQWMLSFCRQGPKKHVCCFDVSRSVQRMLWLCCKGPKKHVCCFDSAWGLQTCERCLSFAAKAPRARLLLFVLLRGSTHATHAFTLLITVSFASRPRYIATRPPETLLQLKSSLFDPNGTNHALTFCHISNSTLQVRQYETKMV